MHGKLSIQSKTKDTDSKNLLKMKELSEITEVSSGTIRYYIQQGLLPQPYRPHKNMAYYDESYIDKIKLIKDLQQNHYLPLSVIKMIIEESGYDPTKIKAWLNQSEDFSWFESKMEENGVESMTKEELLEFSRIDPEDFHAAVKYNMLLPDKNGRFDRESIKLAMFASELRKIGLTVERGFAIEFLVLHYEMLEFIARKEIDVFAKSILNNDMTAQEVQELADKTLDIAYQLAPIVHRRFLRKFLNEMRMNGN
ncbi:MAG: MerR family transcriptional regulator [Proteobacteria bacterium]|nr:MerR family transcriptional regulator [Pseudomonadota bacterium]